MTLADFGYLAKVYCRIAIVLFIYVSYTNKICLYQNENPIDTPIEA
jgi:hypothetical protein